MGEFHIHNSKIEQLSDSGDNYKQVSQSGNNAITQSGNIVNSDGDNARLEVDRPKQGVVSGLLKRLKATWKWIAAYFGWMS